jgi:DNA-binding NarL/FixJ family response regulator
MVIGMDAERAPFLEAVRWGVTGYLLKDASAADVGAAVRAVGNCLPMRQPSKLHPALLRDSHATFESRVSFPPVDSEQSLGQ